MGLDNIPHEYPCRKQGTAIMVEQQWLNDDGSTGTHMVIDCGQTIAADQCPWKQESERTKNTAATYGMLGTQCWFRGQTGTWMLQALIEAGYDDCPGGLDGFFGDQQGSEDEPGLTPAHCKKLSDWMKAHGEVYVQLVRKEIEASAERGEFGFDQMYRNEADEEVPWTIDAAVQSEVQRYRYAAWWLGWVGEVAGGADAWY